MRPLVGECRSSAPSSLSKGWNVPEDLGWQESAKVVDLLGCCVVDEGNGGSGRQKVGQSCKWLVGCLLLLLAAGLLASTL